MARKKVGGAAGKRVSEKIAHLVETGEVPNTPAGRKQAAGKAYGMERAGRLRRGGVYVPKGGGKRGKTKSKARRS